MPEAKDDSPDAVAGQQIELMINERPARDVNQRFGHRLRDRAQAGRQAARQQGDGYILDLKSEI